MFEHAGQVQQASDPCINASCIVVSSALKAALKSSKACLPGIASSLVLHWLCLQVAIAEAALPGCQPPHAIWQVFTCASRSSSSSSIADSAGCAFIIWLWAGALHNAGQHNDK